MQTELEKTLNEVLEYTYVPSLPELYDEKIGDVWIKAIVKVKKLNGHENYAVARFDVSGKPKIIKDFGVTAMIVAIEEIRPYYFLKPQYCKEFKNKEEIISYICVMEKQYTKSELNKLKNSELKLILNNIFIKQQLYVEKQK